MNDDLIEKIGKGIAIGSTLAGAACGAYFAYNHNASWNQYIGPCLTGGVGGLLVRTYSFICIGMALSSDPKEDSKSEKRIDKEDDNRCFPGTGYP